MNLKAKFEKVLKPAVLGWLLFALFSASLFVGYYVTGYRHYLKVYEITQREEIQTIQKEIKSALKQFKGLLELSQSLLSEPTLKSSGNDPRQNPEIQIQEILSKVSLLKPNFKFPSLQRVAFYRLSLPHALITRFGIVPLSWDKFPAEKLVSENWVPQLLIDGRSMVGRINVGNPTGGLKGVLEIQVNLDEFIQFLGDYRAISISSPSSTEFFPDIEGFSFLTGKKEPISFYQYVFHQSSYHKDFLVYLGIFSFLLGTGLYVFNRHFQKVQRHIVENLERNLLAIKLSEESLKETLSKQKKDFDVYKISHEIQKSFFSCLAEKQKYQAKEIFDFLETIKGPHTSVPGMNNKIQDIKLEASLKQALALSNGLWNPEKIDTVDLNHSLQNLHLVFAQKLHQSNIELRMEGLPDISRFKGDSLLIELFLINVVGKAIYRVPNNATVCLKVKETRGFCHLQVQDAGYDEGVAEKVIQQSFGLFIEGKTLNELCQETGVYKRRSKSPQGCNVTDLVIPLFMVSEEGTNNNVVQLFP